MKIALGICSAFAMFVCGSAAAQTVNPIPNPEGTYLTSPNWARNFTLSEQVPTADPNPALSLQERSQDFQIGGNGRWQMNLNFTTRPDDSPLPREEYSAGATYQFTPRFSLGGSVSLGAQDLDDVSRWQEQEVEAGVRLETTFRF